MLKTYWIEGDVRFLLIDTCGDRGSIALSDGDVIVAREALAARGSSSTLLPAVAQLLKACGWTLKDLDAIGVINGPGSFTGVRVGLAAAQGLCEAAGLRLVGVSRLAVLAEVAGLVDGMAVIDAGRAEFYARFVSAGQAREVLCKREDLLGAARVVVCEERLVDALGDLPVEMHVISAAQALGLVSQGGEAGGEANYVRSEAQIYSKAPGGVRP